MKRLLEADREKKSNNSNQIIRINAGGGPILMTTLHTLTHSFPQSMIARQFSRLDMIPRDEEGNYFVDTDYAIFRALLNVLRTPDLLELVPVGVNEEVWWRALDYWGLREYVREVDTTSLFAKHNEEHALKVILFEYRLASNIVKEHFAFEIGGPYIEFRKEIRQTALYANADMSGEILVRTDLNWKEVAKHIELSGYLLTHAERFIEYFNKLLPDHKVTLRGDKGGVAIELLYVLKPELLDKVLCLV